MEILAIKEQLEKNKRRGEEEDSNSSKFSFGNILETFFLKPSLGVSLTYLSLIFFYLLILLFAVGYHINFYYSLVYFPLVYILYSWRQSRKEKARRKIAHRIPFFADALANSLSAGMTLQQAFIHSSYNLKGKIKEEFDLIILKNALGKDLGTLLKDLDAKFPNTGLRYLISLLQEYSELGVGISPLLKRISIALATKEDAEEKIRTILAAGSGYARLSIGVFGAIFLVMSFLMREQLTLLSSPDLRPALFFLLAWAGGGIIMVTRMTSMDFAKSFSLRHFIKKFAKGKKLKMEDLFYYSGMDWSAGKKEMFFYAPFFAALVCSYVASWYTGSPVKIAMALLLGGGICWIFSKYVVQGIVDDQLIKTVDIFPEILQVFVIGLNSGLNIYLAFQFAQDAVKGRAPKVLAEELCRAKFAMECGEAPSKTWERLSTKLPFETVIDFCDIMIIAPMHGESIVNSITQMINSYQIKKLTSIEKKATQLGQLVIPIIVIAFFPLFLFAVFAPLLYKIGHMLGS